MFMSFKLLQFLFVLLESKCSCSCHLSRSNALDTINAAATAIAAAVSRAPQATLHKKKWARGWGVYWCFGFPRHRKRIGHAVILPETASPGRDGPRAENLTRTPSIVLPFSAPPSSPASFLQSEPPSARHSPAGFKSSVCASMYSPEPSSIFSIGPYAHETQLVSPPVFSTFTTEPSTAPFTPPGGSVRLTTPSSPEVPFALLLDSNCNYGDGGQRYPLSHYEFQSYQLYPGSPIGQLISPNSGISGSGTSSPFLDSEFASGGHRFLEFRTAEAPKVLNLDVLFTRDWGSRLCSGSATPDAAISASSEGFTLKPHTSEGASHRRSNSRSRNDGASIGHRVSFELSAEEVTRCVEKEPVAEVVSTSLHNQEETSSIDKSHVAGTSDDSSEKAIDEDEESHEYQKARTITFGCTKDFNFGNADGGDTGICTISAALWVNEKLVSDDNDESENWSFFPVIQPNMN